VRGRGHSAAAMRRRRRWDDGARTTARRRHGHGDGGGQVLAITTSASMTRARQHGDDGAATTRRARCGHDDAGRRCGDGYPQLSSLRSSLDPQSDAHSDRHPALRRTTPPLRSSFRSSLPSSSLRPSSLAGLPCGVMARGRDSGRMPCMPRCCGSCARDLGSGCGEQAGSPIPIQSRLPEMEAASNAVNGGVNKAVDLGWKT